jgi:HK97 family phage major capsid protein
LYLSVNEAYRQSPKCAWFMNDNTRLFLSQVVTKQGLPLIEVRNGVEVIYGKPVRVAPSMDNIGAGNKPVIFGAGEYWVTRKIVDEQSYVRMVKEAPGLIENGIVAMQMFARYDGALAYTDAGSPSPFNFIQNHT